VKQTIGALAILVTLMACTPAEREKMKEEDKIHTQDIAKARETCNSQFVHGDPDWDECMSEQVWSNQQKRKTSQ
jgi:hypothetical protein